MVEIGKTLMSSLRDQVGEYEVIEFKPSSSMKALLP